MDTAAPEPDGELQTPVQRSGAGATAVIDGAAGTEHHRVACKRAASRLLWSRLSEIEELRNDLSRLDELVCAVVSLHHDIAAKLDVQMRLALDYATSAPNGRQRVDAAFSVVLNEVLEELDQ
jgi:hypothetical protein